MSKGPTRRGRVAARPSEPAIQETDGASIEARTPAAVRPRRAGRVAAPAFPPEIASVFDACVRNGDDQSPIRVWVPACGTGEDVYALAVALTERLESARSSRQVRIFATDPDAAAVGHVRAGVYDDRIASELTPARLARFFRRDARGYTVIESLREKVLPAVHHATTDLPFMRLDVVWCRGMLPDLTPDDRERLLARFHLALKPDGHLVLIDCDGIRPSQAMFAADTSGSGVFVRVGPSPSGAISYADRVLATASRPAQADALLAERYLLYHFAPAAVAVAPDGQIVRFFGDVNRYFRLNDGRTSFDLLGLARPPLRPALRALWHAATTRPSRHVERLEVARGRSSRVRITLRHVPEGATDGLWLVVFEELPAQGAEPARPATPVARRLEAELHDARRDRRRLVGELEKSNAALQAMHEETRSMNEELQVTNEQLVRLTDDLRAANEEQWLLNLGLEEKMRELTAVNDDIAAVLASIDVAMVFVDREGRISRFTAAATHLFRLLPSDAGRPLDHLKTMLSGVDLPAAVRSVLAGSGAVEREAEADGGRRYYLRVLPCETKSFQVPGAVVTAVDVTVLDRTQQALRAAQTDLTHLNQTLERRIEERTAWLTLLREVAVAISEAPTSGEALQRVLAQLCVTQGWQLGFVYQPEPETELLVPTVSHVGDGERGLRAFHDLAWRQHYARGDALPGRVYADATPIWIDDAAVLMRSLPIRGRALKGTRLCAAAVVPILVAGEVVGVMELFSTSAHVPGEEHAMLLADVSGQLAKVLERERSTEEVSEFVWREQQELLHTLHDSLGQTLTGLGMLSAGLSQRLASTDPPAVQTAQQIVRQAQLALEDVRKVSKGLFPVDIDAAGLLIALRQLAATTTSLHGIPIEVADDLGTPIRDGRVATQLYRIAQEAVTNAVKHARASRIKIGYAARLGRVTLTIADDGVGIPAERPASAGLGLRIMQHRASTIGATLNVAPGAAGGTEVSCTVRERPGAVGMAD